MSDEPIIDNVIDFQKKAEELKDPTTLEDLERAVAWYQAMMSYATQQSLLLMDQYDILRQQWWLEKYGEPKQLDFWKDEI